MNNYLNSELGYFKIRATEDTHHPVVNGWHGLECYNDYYSFKYKSGEISVVKPYKESKYYLHLRDIMSNNTFKVKRSDPRLGKRIDVAYSEFEISIRKDIRRCKKLLKRGIDELGREI